MHPETDALMPFLLRRTRLPDNPSSNAEEFWGHSLQPMVNCKNVVLWDLTYWLGVLDMGAKCFLNTTWE